MQLNMYYHRIILIMVWLSYSQGERLLTNLLGVHDSSVCKRVNSTLSCRHQLSPEMREFSTCDVEYIPQQDCPNYDIESAFDPFHLPFDLRLYKYKKEIVNNIAFNISFPHPTWKTMRFYLKNQDHSHAHICRKFYVNIGNTFLFTKSLYWDCLLFYAIYIEDNSFEFYVEDDKNVGGIYNFRVPPLKNFDVESTNISSWQVFFFIHRYYMEVSDKLVVTLQPAPFANISYNVSLVKCGNNDTKCISRSVLHSLNVSHEMDSHSQNLLITTVLKRWPMPGNYAVTVQILSSECGELGCSLSISPVYEILDSHKVEIILGLVGILCFSCFLTFLLIRQLHRSFMDYIKRKASTPDEVLVVYHADSQELMDFLHYLSNIMQTIFHLQPLLVDENVGSMNPSEWTRYHICHASKVLFIVPRNLSKESATPIQHQWQCAIKYFSGSYMKQCGNVSSRFAAVFLPLSSQLSKGDEVFSLRRYYLPCDMASLVNWLHRNTFLDKIFFWRGIVKEISGDLSAFINYTVNPSTNPKPFLINKNHNENLNQIGSNVSKPKHSNADLPSEEMSDSQSDLNVDDDEDFDILIPDVDDILRGSVGEDSEDQMTSGDDESENENDNFDIMKYAV